MKKRPGRICLIGAGPGAPDLITVRGLRALERARTILLDNLLPPTFLDDLGVRTGGKRVVRRGEGAPARGLGPLLRLLVEEARRGHDVAHLKGGDPFIFGRSEETIDYLTAQGIAWEVIPGPSSGIAGPTLAGLPLTRRGEARSFAAATARLAEGHLNADFPRADSLVVYMGVEAIDAVSAALLRQGWPADAPAALIERASLPWERRAAGTLSGIAAVAARAHVASPAILLVGKAASPWSRPRRRPLLLFTGLDPAPFRALGDLLHWPALRLAPDAAGRRKARAAAKALGRREYGAAVFSGQAGVVAFFEILAGEGLDARSLAGAFLVAVGDGAAQRLAHHGLRPDAASKLPAGAGRKALIVAGTHVPRDIREALVRKGWRAAELVLHRAVPHPELGRPLPEHDAIYFTSPGGVRAYAAAYGREAFARGAWCMGEQSKAEVEKRGGTARVVAAAGADEPASPGR